MVIGGPMPGEKIVERIKASIKTDDVVLYDLTGGGDHWQVTVVSSEFDGKPLIQQHRMVLDLFKSEIASNVVHALSVKTYTPERWKTVSAAK